MTHDLQLEIQDLRQRLEEAEDTLTAIRNGEVDALVVSGAAEPKIYTLNGADHPYRVLVEGMQQGAVTLSVDGTILYCNDSFNAMTQRSHESIIGQKIEQFFCAGDRPLLLRQLSTTAKTTEKRQAELSLCCAGGGELPVLASSTWLPLENTAAMCLIVTDLTEHRQNQSLKDSDRRKDEFLAMLAHELRNPLAPIANAVEVLNWTDSSGQPHVRAACDVISRQVLQMTRLVDDLLDVSRITRGKINLQLAPADVAMIVTSAVETSRPLIEARQHQLQIHWASEPLKVAADVVRLSQALTNLLNNAAKYTDVGGQICLSIEREGNEVAIRVRDNGIGLPEEMLPKVFELFTQADRAIDRAQGGLGIGLTLVRSLVEMHRGTVSAASQGLGHGSVFTLRLPLLTAAESPSDEPQRNESAPRNTASRRILVVDDNVDAADTLARLLIAMGHEAQTAFDGHAGLTKARAFEPELVLLDIGLPGMNGYAVAERLRQQPETSGAVIVALTGYGDEHDRQLSQQAGFDQHLVKPLDYKHLQQLLAGL